MSEFLGYGLILESIEELKNFIEAFEKATTRSSEIITDTVNRALAIIDLKGDTRDQN